MKLGNLIAASTVAMSSPLFMTAAIEQNEFTNFNFTVDHPFESASESDNGVTAVYETFALFVFQSFFDHISADILPPLLENLDYFTFGPIGNDTDTLGDEDVLISWELENIKIRNASIDPSPSGVVLSDDDTGVTVGFKNLTFKLEADYHYITDPPIFADLGDATIHFANTSFFTDIRSEVIRMSDGHKLQL